MHQARILKSDRLSLVLEIIVIVLMAGIAALMMATPFF